jgi:hypothetical protein
MLMEMKLFKTGMTNDEVKESMRLHEYNDIIVKDVENGVIVTLTNPNHVVLYNTIRRSARKRDITVFERQRFYASFSKLVTAEMVDSYDNSIDPYYTVGDIGTYTFFSGLQVNTFEEAWEQLEIYARESNRPLEQYRVTLRIIEDDKARVY